MRRRGAGLVPLLLTALVLSGCGGMRLFEEQDGAPAHSGDFDHVPDAAPRIEPRSAYGNPDSYVVNGRRYHVRDSAAGYRERGIASWYGTKFHGRRTSSGEPYDMYAMTAAHRSLPLPTYVRVTNLRNGRQVVVRVNDRGPFHPNRIIDLSYAAAHKLGITAHGTGLVEVEAIVPGQKVQRAGKQASPAVVANGRASTPGLYLQVGAFINQINAQRLRDRLIRSAFDRVQIQSALAGDRPVYRVRLGPLRSVDQADQLAQTLSSLGYSQPRIVID
ncbi:MAG: septal ring lytic transglycosylase RlpA family protein [Gammaproteobacteria bacterium]